MPLPTLRELAAFVTPAPDPSMLVNSVARMADARRMATERQIQDRQFALDQQNAMQRHSEGLAFDYANLDETQRHAMAGEQHARDQLAQQQAVKQAEVMAAIDEAARNGASLEELQAMEARARAMGIDVRREGGGSAGPQASPSAGAPSSDGAIQTIRGADGRERATPGRGFAPAPSVPLAAFGLGPITYSAGGEQLGTIDPEAIAAGQARQFAPAAEAYVKGARPGDRAPRELAANTVGRLPGLTQRERFDAMQKEADAQLDRETSERNARQMSIRQSGRGASLDTARADAMATRKANTVAQRMGLQGVNESLRHADESIALMESGNPISQNDAFLAHLRLQQGSRPTDKDLVFQLKQGGLYTRVMNALHNVDSGKFDPGYQTLFIEAARRHKSILEQKRFKIAEATRNYILSSRGIRDMVGLEAQLEYADEQAAAVLGGFSEPTGGPAGAQGGGSSMSISASGDIVPGPDDEAADEFLE